MLSLYKFIKMTKKPVKVKSYVTGEKVGQQRLPIKKPRKLRQKWNLSTRELKSGYSGKDLEWGFDLTDISPADWSILIRKYNLRNGTFKVRYSSNAKIEYPIWRGKDVVIITANNPITGVYSEPNRRAKEVGYASYIGILGNPAKVEKIADFIRKHGRSKGESKREREFI